MLESYRKAFSSGDINLIMDLVDSEFNFIWVPENTKMDEDSFPDFFLKFKENIETTLKAKYSMEFENIILTKVIINVISC